MAARWPRNGLGRRPEGSKKGAKVTKLAQGWAKHDPRGSKVAHEGAKRGPKVAPDGPKMSQDGSKVAEGPQGYPKKAQEEDKMTQDRVS